MLEKADRFQRNVIAGQARRAGRAPKTDALQQYIVALVRKQPNITAPQVLARLEREPRGGLIQEIVDSVICFTQPDGTEEGRTKKAPVSGLKDRLSRAKKQENSR